MSGYRSFGNDQSKAACIIYCGRIEQPRELQRQFAGMGIWCARHGSFRLHYCSSVNCQMRGFKSPGQARRLICQWHGKSRLGRIKTRRVRGVGVTHDDPCPPLVNGDASPGQQLAQKGCRDCHAVGAEDAEAYGSVPSFVSIAEMCFGIGGLNWRRLTQAVSRHKYPVGTTVTVSRSQEHGAGA
jgi:hypothetical protein